MTWAVSELLPLPSVTLLLQLPSPCTTALPTGAAPSKMVTVAPASATSTVPVTVSAAWLVGPPELVIATVGATVSTVSVGRGGRAELPAASVATAVTTRAPWPAGVIDVVQWPVPSTVTAVPFTVRVEPISAVPLTWIPPAASAALIRLSPPSIVVIATARRHGVDRQRRRGRS